MKPVLLLLLLLLVILISALSIGQTPDSLKLTKEETKYFKKLLKNDIVNWPNKVDNYELGTIGIKCSINKMFGEKIFVKIKTDSATYNIDIIEEISRRIIGGFAGSFPNVESWVINASETELISKLNRLKKDNQRLKPSDSLNLKEGKSSYWYFINFYIPELDEIAFAWVRGDENGKSSTIALVSFSTIEGIKRKEKRKLINSDYWLIENGKRIGLFKKHIIYKVDP